MHGIPPSIFDGFDIQLAGVFRWLGPVYPADDADKPVEPANPCAKQSGGPGLPPAGVDHNIDCLAVLTRRTAQDRFEPCVMSYQMAQARAEI